MNIGLDLDDTIVDHGPHLKKLARKYGCGFSCGEVPCDAILKARLPEEKYKQLKRELWEMSSCAGPVKDSQKIIQALSEEGHELYIISRRVTESEIGHQWIEKHLPYLNRENTFFVEHDCVKGMLCKELHVVLFLDNKERVLEHMPEITRGILFDRFNLHEKSLFARVRSWKKFYDLCQEIKAKKTP